MIRIGITGQSGFIGTNLSNYLTLKKEEISIIPFQDNFFESAAKLEQFVNHCDVIIHLAAVNRHSDPKIIYNTNIELVKSLIFAIEKSKSKTHIYFASSIQEQKDNPYGNSKRDGRLLLESFSEWNNTELTALIIPNVFGQFGNPYYNSVIATFCYQLTHNIEPKIEIDSKLDLIYVNELVEFIYNQIVSSQGHTNDTAGNILNINVPPTSGKFVSEILSILMNFKELYLQNGIIPDLAGKFEKNLFNTFISYIDIDNFFPYSLSQHTDQRGSFVELIKSHNENQVSFSTTKPGISRGNHFHTRKLERFVVLKGKALIQIRRVGTEKVIPIEVLGNNPSFVDIPIWHTHSITNIGDEDLYTMFWTNEFFDPSDPDTYYEQVNL